MARARPRPIFYGCYSNMIKTISVNLFCCYNEKQQIWKILPNFLGCARGCAPNFFWKNFASWIYLKICKFIFLKRIIFWKVNGRPYGFRNVLKTTVFSTSFQRPDQVQNLFSQTFSIFIYLKCINHIYGFIMSYWYILCFVFDRC